MGETGTGCSNEHRHGLPREARKSDLLDEIQKLPVFNTFAEEVGLDEVGAAQRGAEDIDSVCFRPLSPAFGV